MRIARILAPAALLLSAGWMSSCASPYRGGTWSAVLRSGHLEHLQTVQEAVVKLVFLEDYGIGCTGVYLGNNRFLTCRHCLPESALMPKEQLMKMVEQFEPGATVKWGHPVRINNQDAFVEAVAWGASPGPPGDWAILELRDPQDAATLKLRDDLPVRFDPNRKVQAGEEVLLFGFPQKTEPERVGQRPSIFRARAVSPPLLVSPNPHTFWARLETPEELIGLSGGPAVVWDPKQRCPVIVGILSEGAPLMSQMCRVPEAVVK